MHKDSHDYDDIVNLNEELYEKEKPVPLNEEQKKQLRKKILILLFIIVIFIIIMVFYYAVLPQRKLNQNKKAAQKQAEKIKLETPKTLSELENGKLSLKNEEVLDLVNLLSLNYHNNSYLDLKELFTNNKFNISTASDLYKIYFASKTDTFNQYLLEKELSSCSSFNLFTKVDLLKVLNESMNLKMTTFPKNSFLQLDFNSRHNYSKLNILADELIEFSCLNIEHKSDDLIISTKILEANKSDEGIVLEIAPLFFLVDGIYSDLNFTNKLSDDPNIEDLDPFYDQAVSYKFLYKLHEGKYYLNGRY